MKNLLIFSIIFIGLSNCTKPIEVDLPKHEEKLVVNCLFSPDAKFMVNVSASVQINKRFPKFLNNATVSLYRNNEFLENLSYTSMDWEEGYYFSSSIPEENSEYKIVVEHVDYPDVQAVNSVPALSEITDVSLSEEIYFDEGWEYKQMSIQINDPASKKNFYEILLILTEEYNFSGSPEKYGYPIYLTSDDIVIKTEDILEYGELESLVFSDKLFDGQNYQLKVRFANQFSSESNSSKIYIILRSITEEYYINKKKLIKHQLNDYFDLWEASEPVQLYTNIDNGFGIFAAYNTAIDSIDLFY